MANSDDLRKNVNQHKPKNTESKFDDKNIAQAMQKTIDYIENRFGQIPNFNGFYLEFSGRLSLKGMMENIKNGSIRKQFDTTWEDNTIMPDGGLFDTQKTRRHKISKTPSSGRS